MSDQYQICARCVMDTSAPDIRFGKDGICSYCTDFLSRSGKFLEEDPVERKRRLDVLVGNVRDRGKGNPYDCVVGVSGGVDSSWALVKTVEMGLRPLAVHMDNGWNSELAQNNIANLVRGLDVDLYTHVIDWEEYRALMQAFFDADVINIELLYDNAMLAVNFQQAARYQVKYILAGTNTTSEGVLMPRDWAWHNFDKKNIKEIAKQLGNVRLSSFPAIGTFDRIWFEVVKRCRWVSLLDHIEYNKFEAMTQLSDQYGYKPYPYKHYESIFTRFYQGFILPEKFGVDKRRLHFSSLIIAGQMGRESALRDLEQIPYPDKQVLKEDKAYFLKKMNWSEDQLADYLSRPRVEHDVYGSERKLYERLSRIYARFMRK